MKTAPATLTARRSRRAFTLAEIMVATAIGSAVAGSMVVLLVQSATEQRNAFANMTVEEKAYQLQANLTTCLRSMSANQGLTPNYASGLFDANGNLLGYQSAIIFYPTNGGYITGTISYNSASGQVVYTPNVLAPSAQVIWMSNTATAALTEFCLSTSFNLDGSQNSSLVNVLFQMNDNGFSQQNPAQNLTSVLRNFSIQMRNDN